MSKTKILLLSILILIFGYFLCTYLFKGECLTAFNTLKDQRDESITQNNFRLEARYTEVNKWEYTVTGQLPNPCYTASVDTTIAESYPEQVTVRINIFEPEQDMVCTQVIQDYSYQGTFSASEKATISLEVK